MHILFSCVHEKISDNINNNNYIFTRRVSKRFLGENDSFQQIAPLSLFQQSLKADWWEKKKRNELRLVSRQHDFFRWSSFQSSAKKNKNKNKNVNVLQQSSLQRPPALHSSVMHCLFDTQRSLSQALQQSTQKKSRAVTHAFWKQLIICIWSDASLVSSNRHGATIHGDDTTYASWIYESKNCWPRL